MLEDSRWLVEPFLLAVCLGNFSTAKDEAENDTSWVQAARLTVHCWVLIDFPSEGANKLKGVWHYLRWYNEMIVQYLD